MSFSSGVNKTSSNEQFLAFSAYKPDIQLSSELCLVSAHSLIRCDVLSLNPVLFICNFPVHFFPYDNDKEFYK